MFCHPYVHTHTHTHTHKHTDGRAQLVMKSERAENCQHRPWREGQGRERERSREGGGKDRENKEIEQE